VIAVGMLLKKRFLRSILYTIFYFLASCFGAILLYYSIGLVLMTSNPKAAISFYTKFIEIGLVVPVSYESRAAIRYGLGDKKGAIEDYTSVINLTPSVPWNYAPRGWARLNTGDKKGALEDYTSAINLLPDNPNFYTDRAKVWIALGDSKKANMDRDRAKSIKEASAK
jgi:tetratricopeptide (TPR) repeat protein